MGLDFTKNARSILILLALTLACFHVQAQSDIITGVVTDESGEPLPGANVVIKGTTTGTTTDGEGMYSLRLNTAQDVLVFSFVGYLSQEISTGNRSVINVSLTPDVHTMDEIVVVGYGTQKRESVTGAISQIEGTELLKAPVGNLTSRLGGVVPGVVSLQQSGQPGADGAGLTVRGTAPKYIVDGVERPFAEIDPNEVETISVLKDAASAAVYGLDANAVVIVTTKRGKEGASRISFNATHGVSTNALMLDMLDGPEYAYWYNRAREMDGDQPVFTQEHVEKMRNGDDSDGWGNTDWYKKTFGVGKTANYNVNATGGTDKFNYFVSLGNFRQEGNVKGFNYNRLNLRSNIDAVIADNLKLSFGVGGRIEQRERPGYSASPGDWNNIPQQAMRAHPYVPQYIDGVPVSTRTASSFVNPLAASDLTGYNRSRGDFVQTNIALNYDVPFVKGLSLKFLTAYDIGNTGTKAFNKPYYTQVASSPTAGMTDLNYVYAVDARGNSVSLIQGLSRYAQLVTNSSIKYENQFGKHSINALALVETFQRDANRFGAYGYDLDILSLDELDRANLEDERTKVTGGSDMERIAGYVGRINYSYADKYFAEVSTRYDGSYVFGGMVPGKRWAPFPAASLGWAISQEDWFPASGQVNYLKLRGSVGLTGTTQIDPYFFLNTLSMLQEPAAVIGGEPHNGLITSKPANINLTWAKALQYNAGFDATLLNTIDMEFDVFYKYIYDMLSSAASTYPDSYGGYVPGYQNDYKQEHKGFEIALSHTRNVGAFYYKVGVVGSYTKRRWLRYGDSENTPDWLKLTGKEVGAQVGFISAGLFQSQEEIENSALITGKAVRVGDIKYVDRNGDGVISYEQDRGYIGKSNHPKFMGGFTFDARWKGFDLSLFVQGSLGRDQALTGVYSSGVMDNTSMTKPFYHGGNSPRYLVENSWREDNTDAEFPRLAVVTASSNNAFSSTFWYRNGDYLRVKSLQIGYSLPKVWLDAVGINNVRIYGEGANLFTWSALTKYGIDPEQPNVSNGFYPQQRIYSMGLKLTF